MANIGGLFSNLESGLNALDNKNGKMDKAKEVFRREINVSKEMADKAEDLIDTFEDMDKAYEDHKDIVEDCDKEIQKLTNSISNLQGHLNNATTQQSRNRIQGEIDKKQRELLDKQSKRDVNARKRDEAEAKRDKANRRFDKLFGRRIAMGDITALNNKNKAISAISSGGKFANMANGLKGLKGNPYMMIAEGLIKAVEFGIGKATEYVKLNAENYIRYLNSSNQVLLNNLQSNIASWEDALNGSYVSQEMAFNSLETLQKAQNETALNNLKLANTWTNWIPFVKQLNAYQEQLLQLEQQRAELDLKNATALITKTQEFNKKTDDYLRKQDSAIHQYQTQNGLTTKQSQIFGERMISQSTLFSKYNKTIEDVIKLQTDFIQQSGRNVNFSNSDMEKSLAVGRLVGDDTFTQFSAQMNVFNQSVSSSADIMYDMYNYANKMGLSQQKLTKNVLSNLKLANKYDFKNGSKGFIELAKWAENVRFNLSSLGGMLEKIQSGGLEGTVETSAKLQVLGGHFAMGSDPLAMMWESLNDPDAYAKRTKGMFKGLGTYDKTTGETTFNGTDTLLIRNAASALGMSVEDAKDMIREDNKKAVIRRQVHNSNLSSEQMDAVANKAHRDAVTGKWMVNMLDNSTKDISTITSADLQNILSDNSDENMSRYAQSTLSSVEKIESSTKFIAALLGGETYFNFLESVNKSIQTEKEAYSKNSEAISSAIEMNRNEALKEQINANNVLIGINEKLANAYIQYEESNGAIKKINEKLTKIYDDKLNEINKAKNETNSKHAEFNKVLKESNDVGYWERFAKGQELQSKAGDASYARMREKWAKGDYINSIGEFISGTHQHTFGRLNQFISNLGGKINKRDLSTINLAKIYSSLLLSPLYGEETNELPINTKDGLISSNGSSMLTAASNVTPIHDGSVQLAKSDPKDSAIFAKTGGPFDTLFNGIFAKINEVSEILPKSMLYNMPIDIRKSLSESLSHSKDTTNNSYNQTNPIKIELNGKLELTNGNGQSVDIINTIKNNPMLLRQLTELISQSINENIYGGRTTFNAGVTTSRYKPL